jgi:hypothetical protein
MKSIKIFMPGKRDAQKEVFTLELSRLLPRFSFCPEYEQDGNPYIIEDLLSNNTGAFIIAFNRSDVSNLTIMALSKNLPIIFFIEELTTDLSVNEHYFLDKIMEMKKCTFTDLVNCTANKGTNRLAAQINSFLKD